MSETRQRIALENLANQRLATGQGLANEFNLENWKAQTSRTIQIAAPSFLAAEQRQIRRFRSWQCQKCGAPIGWIGRVFQFIRVPLHKCSIDAALK